MGMPRCRCCRLLRNAIAALAIERDVVITHDEARGGQVCQITWASVHIKNFVTAPALKVVVVVSVLGKLKARVFARQFDDAQRLLFNHRFEIAIHRGQTKPWHLCLRGDQHFVR